MKTETILNAFQKATWLDATFSNSAMPNNVYKEKAHAFRSRILRLDAEKDAEIARLRKQLHEVGWVHALWKLGGSR